MNVKSNLIGVYTSRVKSVLHHLHKSVPIWDLNAENSADFWAQSSLMLANKNKPIAIINSYRLFIPGNLNKMIRV